MCLKHALTQVEPCLTNKTCGELENIAGFNWCSVDKQLFFFSAVVFHPVNSKLGKETCMLLVDLGSTRHLQPPNLQFSGWIMFLFIVFCHLGLGDI
jgi:hypothetical protein